MKPFKLACNEVYAAWMRRNPGLRITNYDIAGLVSEAFTKSCKMEIAKNGFSCTGIYPFCRDVFSDFDFLPAEMTDALKFPTKQQHTQTNTLGLISFNQQQTIAYLFLLQPVMEPLVLDIGVVLVLLLL